MFYKCPLCNKIYDNPTDMANCIIRDENEKKKNAVKAVETEKLAATKLLSTIKELSLKLKQTIEAYNEKVNIYDLNIDYNMPVINVSYIVSELINFNDCSNETKETKEVKKNSNEKITQNKKIIPEVSRKESDVFIENLFEALGLGSEKELLNEAKEQIYSDYLNELNKLNEKLNEAKSDDFQSIINDLINKK